MAPSIASVKRKNAAKAKAREAPKPQRVDESDDSEGMPPLQNVASCFVAADGASTSGEKKDQVPEGSGEEKENAQKATATQEEAKKSKGGAGPKDGGDKDVDKSAKDRDADGMPPLTAEPSVGPPRLRPVTFSKGSQPSKLFNFAPINDSIDAAYKHLDLDPCMTDDSLRIEADKLMGSETSAQRGHSDTSSRLGALLTILCSRTKLHSIPSAPSTTHTLQRQLRLLYLSEAQLHMTNVRLPLPEDAVVPSDVELRTDSMAQELLMDERQAHDRTRERVKQAQIALEKATTAQVAARNRAEKSEGEAKSLRGEVSKLRGEKDELKLQAKEGYAAKHEAEKEVEKLRDEMERYKREAQVSTAGPDKKDFVIQRLGKQVQDLTKQLRVKTDENLKLMLDLATAGVGDA
ncbi:hypothetical protein Rhopal_006805-T1 [Rhodotorula paludigena]|uniref:Uncharacterized protein n=1 Tax=Rhodotorula paludigena TaxID=86838 RepID=A0AAV5GU39_9BASI|nr:hypothetical protein Rhopal_006805-T1 [Rhodotorula paludigena]